MSVKPDLSTLKRLRDDYCFFLSQIWIEQGLHIKAPLSEVELDIARWGAYGPPRRGILAPRGIGKTHLVTGGLAVFRWFRDPQRKIIILSKSAGEAEKTVSLIRHWIETTSFLQHLIPRDAKRQTDTKKVFDVGPARKSRQASCSAYGIESTLPSNRAHTIICDDVETDGNVKTLEARTNLREQIKECAAILYPASKHDVDPPEIIDIGTFHHEDSFYIHRAASGYAYRTWPIMYPQEGDKFVGLSPLIEQNLASGKNKAGDPTVPLRFPQTEIDIRKKEGWRWFAMQCMLLSDLATTNRYPLSISDLMVMDVHRDQAPISVIYGRTCTEGSTEIRDLLSDGFNEGVFHRPATISREWAPYTSTKGWIDPAGRGADHTGVAAVGHLAGLLHVKGLLGFSHGPTSGNLMMLAEFLRNHDVRECYIEDNFGRGTWRMLFEPILMRAFLDPGEDPKFPKGWRCSLHDRNSHFQKEATIIDMLEPVVSTHRLIVDRSVAANEEFQRQFSRITREKNSLGHEDELEAVARCVGEWMEQMSMDPRKAAERAKERLLEQELKEHYKALGRDTPTPRFFVHEHEAHMPKPRQEVGMRL